MPLANTDLEHRQVCKLLQCVRDDDRDGIRRLIRGGVPDLVNLISPSLGNGGETALGLAAAENRDDMVSFLLELEAHPDVTDGQHRTPLMRAAEFGHVQTVERLLNNKPVPDLRITDIDGKGVLFYCIAPTQRHEKCASLILKMGSADVNNCSNAGVPVLLQACETAHENEQFCLMLLEKGADPSSKDQKTHRSALMAASSCGSAAVADAMLQRGAEVDCITQRTRTHAAHEAARNGNINVLRVLSAYRATFDQTDDLSNTPIHYAASNGHALCVRFLAQRGCNPRPKNKEGLTARQLARNSGHKDAGRECQRAERFFGKTAKNVEPWKLSLYDYSCVHAEQFMKTFQQLDDGNSGKISRDDFIEAVQNLCELLPEEANLDEIAAVNERDKGQVDYKLFLLGQKYINKQYLLSAYEGKKKKGKKGRSGGKAKKTKLPMPICTRDEGPRTEDGGPPEINLQKKVHATDLTRFDRDFQPRHAVEDDSYWYMTPCAPQRIHVRDMIRHRDVSSLCAGLNLMMPSSDPVPAISTADRLVDIVDRFYKTPLMAACAKGDINLVKMFVSSGASVNAQDNFKWTPLHFACHSGMKDVVEYLLDEGANIDAAALNGGTPLMKAIESSQPDVVQLLINRGAKMRTENRSGETPMDIADKYAYYPVYSIVKAKWDSLPPIKDKKAAKKPKASAQKPKPSAQTELANQVKVMKKPGEDVEMNASNSRQMKSSLIRSVSMHGSASTAELHDNFVYYPKVSWSDVPTTDILIGERVKRRKQYGWEVDFDDFKLPFMKNVAEKLSQLPVDVLNG